MSTGTGCGGQPYSSHLSGSNVTDDANRLEFDDNYTMLSIQPTDKYKLFKNLIFICAQKHLQQFI